MFHLHTFAALTLTVPSLLAAANLVADRSKQTELRGCCPASIVPISATMRASHIFTAPSASQETTFQSQKATIDSDIRTR